jgi:3-methyladenine DNA glycosylase AlkD
MFTDGEKDYVKAATAWTIGQIGKHSSEHVLHLTNQNGLTLLLEAHLDRYASEDL